MTTNIYAQHYGEEGPTLTPNNLGLVYENAIEKYEDGKVNIHKVNYKVDGIDVVGNVYTPAGYTTQPLWWHILTEEVRIRLPGSMPNDWRKRAL